MITIEPPSKLSNLAVVTLSRSGLTRFLNRARAAVDLDGNVDVLLTSDAALRRLNRDFRGKDKPTDVLSFPSPEEIAQEHAGDLAISLETAARQAARFGHTLRDEVRVLMLHGLLHLSGMDHETDDGEMAARETELRRELRLPVSLIERVSPIEFVRGPKRNAGVLRSAQNDDRKGSRQRDERKRSRQNIGPKRSRSAKKKLVRRRDA